MLSGHLGDRPLIEVVNLSKSFLGVRALNEVSFSLSKGELHCIIGENGAGKSTFIKIVSGALTPDGGEIRVDGKRFSALTPHVAQGLGIAAVYQENILVPQLSVAENLYIGREYRTRFGFFSYRDTFGHAKNVLESFHLPFLPGQRVADLSPADKQLLKIVKAIESNPRVLIMDEPTATIDAEGIDRVLELVKTIKARGIGVIYISHHLEEILEIADRITVLKDGQIAGRHNRRSENVTMDQLAQEMIGRPLDKFYARQRARIGEVILAVSGLRLTESSKPISFELREGEILGIAGMAGSGRSEIVRALYGADQRKTGTVAFRGREVPPGKPGESIRSGIGLLTEDRKASGLSMSRSVRENISILGLDRFTRFFMRLRKEVSLVAASVRSLDIKTPSLNQEVRFLSGGNQQKVVMAKWLFREVDVLIFDEPTIGIDVNTKTEIYRLMAGYVARGKSIIMVSSEMPELISMSDRVLVIRQGSVSAVLEGPDITERNILSNSMGGRR
jgi:ABC-type sugar transport system ATPase subunit